MPLNILKRRSRDDFNWESKNRELVEMINNRELDNALVLGQEIIEYVDKKHRKDSKEKATSYNNMGMVFLLHRDFDLAEECFQSALVMRKNIFGENHNEVAVILLNLAHLYQVQAQEIMLVNRVETSG